MRLAPFRLPGWARSRLGLRRDGGGCGEGKFAGCGDHDVVDGPVASRGRGPLDLPDDVHSLDDVTKHDVPAVQPRGGGGGDEELRSVGVGSRVGHGENARPDVVELVQGKGLIRELAAVDGVPARAVTSLEITALDHEVGDDAVEDGVLVPEVPLARRELPEVLHRLRHVLAEQTDDYPPLGLAADGHVEVHLVGDLGVA